MTPRSGPRLFTFSLLELMLLFAFLGVGCAALKFAGDTWWTVLSAVTLLAMMAAAVVAFVARGKAQAFAIGVTVCAVIYGALLAASPYTGGRAPRSRELNPYSGNLPTSRLLRPAYDAVVTHKFVDVNTGQEIFDFDPTTNSGLSVMGTSTPVEQDFMAVGHLLWMLLLGYTGGRLGVIIYSRRAPAED